jgi:hypothetical protein
VCPSTERAGQLGIDPATQERLASAADAQVWPAWRAVTHQWDIASTGPYTGAGISPVAAEFGDLALRLGRLAYRNPQWTPDCGEASLVRLPEDLGSSPNDICSVLSAAHHAVDAVARIAIEDREAARAAAADHRLYVPTRLAPEEWDIPYPYSPAPSSLVDELLITYDTAIEANKHAVAALDDVAITMGTPSHILATARAVCASHRVPIEMTDLRCRCWPVSRLIWSWMMGTELVCWCDRECMGARERLRV